MFKSSNENPDSLVASVQSLAQRLGIDVSNKNLQTFFAELEPDEDVWHILSVCEPHFEVVEIGEYSTWPRDNNAIVKFQYRSLEEPSIDGKANMIDHYCMVADWANQQILDPADGQTKGAGYYGQPISWAIYKLNENPSQSGSKKNEDQEPDPRTHIVVTGETIWRLAQKFGIPAEDLIDHNDLDPPYELKPGFPLHLPYAQDRKKTKLIEYEVLPEPRPMHVNKKDGCRKWSFGFADKWSDIKPTGPTNPEYSNVDIVAIAHVPVNDGEKEIKVAYMMDSLALGDYKNTGRVAFTIGYNHTHLSDGHVDKKKPQVNAAVAEKINTASALDVKIAKTPNKVVDLTPKTNYHLYKTTQKVLNEQRIPKTYLANDNLMVREMDGRRPDRPLYKHQGVKIFSTFEKDGVLYGRPVGSFDNGYWFGIPMDKLIDEDELYNTQLDLPTRVASHGSLTMQERWVVALSKVLSQGTKIAAVFKNKNNQKE